MSEYYDASYDKEHPRNLIPELCRQFYHLGWVTGTGGGISPPEKQLKKSQCTPLFMCAYLRRHAGAVIHTHSKFAVMATLLWRDDLDKIIVQYPETCAVLVRRHGIYVWGDSWQQAKTMTECYDYLLDIAVQMKQCKLDPAMTPNDYELKYQANNTLK